MEYKDYSYLITKSHHIINKYHTSFSFFDFDVNKAFKLNNRFKKYSANFSLVLAEDTALELGAPSKKSMNLTMWTKQKNHVLGKLIIIGNDLASLSSNSVSFMQIALLEIKNDAKIDDFNMSRIMNMTNKIPGYMTRNMSGKIWARIHKNLLSDNFNLYTLGQSIYSLFINTYNDISKIDIILAADNQNIISEFESIFNATKVIAGENKKLKWIEDGLITCDELNCKTCDEKPTCDTLKDVVKRKF